MFISLTPGFHGHGYFLNLFENINRKYIRRWLEREPDQALDEKLFAVQRQLAYHKSLSQNQIAGAEQNGEANHEHQDGEGNGSVVAQQQPRLDGGGEHFWMDRCFFCFIS